MVKRKASSRKKPASAADTATKLADSATMPVVGIGASAGGLEAFKQFFSKMPAVSGLSFVLVPHLDPEHHCLLGEILQRTTSMPVVEAMHQMALEPDHVYIIPPNRYMAIFHGTLQLFEPELPHGQRMPIDYFLRSLAEDQGELAIGIILSGAGTDGTLGLRDIIGSGGITLVQSPTTAEYDGMPASAVQAGYATQVLPVAEMPQALLTAVQNLLVEAVVEKPQPAVGLNRILTQVRSATGNDFSLYKKSTIGRRIERRMAQHNLTDLDVYASYLKQHPAEMPILFKELLINVTSFFRDPEAFVVLKEEVLPQLLADKPDDYVFRVWVAGGATGEEAYSIAMLLREYMDETNQEFKVQLYSTDLSDDAIAIARTGYYPPNIVSDVSKQRLLRFFIKDDAGYRVKKEIREMVVFAVQNIIKDPPFTKLDLLCCRNLMIYLETELQARLIPVFHYALRPGGVLFLSPSESINNRPELFAAINRKWKLYRVVNSRSSERSVLADGQAWTVEKVSKVTEVVVKKSKDINLAELTRRALIQYCAPAAVVTDLDGNILFVHGETGRYLRPAPGQANLNVVNMAREFLQLELRSAVAAVTDKSDAPMASEGCIMCPHDNKAVHFSVRPIKDLDSEQSVLLVIFQDVDCQLPANSSGDETVDSSSNTRVESLERDLAYTRENLQATIEEEQASNEELKATNEELQSTNEELQSTNEELETSREELQSVNEELVTVNAELQAKIEQLADMQNDMKNLLDNFSVGTIFLDQNMDIRRFTREAAQIYRLVESDVGRSLADIKSDIKDDDLLADAQAVLDTLVPCEREVCTVGGVWYLVRIQPYRTLDNIIAGVVMAFTDISQRIEAEANILEARLLPESIVNTVHEPLLVLDAEMKVVLASRSFFSYFKADPQETVGCSVFSLGDGQWDIPALRKLLETILPRDTSFDGFTVKHDFPGIGPRELQLNARRMVSKDRDKQLILLAMQEVVAGG